VVAERIDEAHKRLRPTRVADRDLVADVDESLGKRAADVPRADDPILISHPPGRVLASTSSDRWPNGLGHGSAVLSASVWRLRARASRRRRAAGPPRSPPVGWVPGVWRVRAGKGESFGSEGVKLA
jgi:hypothetical protein